MKNVSNNNNNKKRISFQSQFVTICIAEHFNLLCEVIKMYFDCCLVEEYTLHQ